MSLLEKTLHYPDGALYARIRFLNGKKEGAQEFFYPKGQIKTVEHYVQGKLHGKASLYWENGRLKRETYFQEGIKQGLEQIWNEEGVLQDIEHKVPCSSQLFLERFPKLAFLAPTWEMVPCAFEELSSISFGNEDAIYVYGLGLGAPYFQLRSWLKENGKRKLIFLEDHPGYIASFLLHPMSSSVLLDPQVHIELLSQDIAQIVEQFPFERIEVLSLPSRKGAYFRSLRLKLLRACALSFACYLDRIQGDRLFSNFVRNVSRLPQSFYANGLKNAFQGMPAIVCGAGASLNQAIPLLKELSNHALIIAGGSTLAALSSQGVPIHFGLAIDPNKEEYQRFKNNFAFETPLLYSTRVHPDIFHTCNGPFGYMRSGIGGILEIWMEEHLDLLDPLIGSALSPESISVTNVCTAWAEFLGCDRIFFSGVDLAYTDKKRYADGVNAETTLMRSTDKTSRDRIMKRKNHLGQNISTAVRFMMEGISLSHFAKKHKHVRFFNTGARGLSLKGIPYLPLQEVKEKYLQQTFDFQTLVHEKIQEHPMPSQTANIVAEKMEALQMSICRIVGHLEILSGKKKGSLHLAEVELEEEMAAPLLFYDIYQVLERGRLSGAPLAAQEKWERFLQIAVRYCNGSTQKNPKIDRT